MSNKLLTEMDKVYQDCMAIATKKNHDYAGSSTDPFANFRTFGWKGIMVRISDKWQRMLNFYHKQEYKVIDESFEDTIKDAINYLTIMLVMYREEAGWRVTKSSTVMSEGQVHVGPMLTRDAPLAQSISNRLKDGPHMTYNPETQQLKEHLAQELRFKDQFSYKPWAKHHPKCDCYDCITGGQYGE
jgi:hypothetical protein